MPSVKELEINNTVYDVKGKTVVDNNSGELSFWSGSKAQYDAIVTKDPNTLYNITDDTDVSLTILETVWPVGSVYITTNNTCPLSTLISGSTWELVSSGIVKSGEVPVRGNGMTLGLTDGVDNCGLSRQGNQYLNPFTGLYGTDVGTTYSGNQTQEGKSVGITLDPTKSGMVLDTTSFTLSVNIYERTA